MTRLTFKPASEVYEDPSIPENQFCVYVDGYPILKETVYQPGGINNYFSANNSIGLAPFFINHDQVTLELVERISPMGALKFTRKSDPEAWMICDLFELQKNNVFCEIYKITENHETPYCLKSPRQIANELEERRLVAKEILNERQRN